MTLQVEYRPLRSLVPYARNARTHSSSQVQKLRESLAKFGWARPIAIADGVVIYGHGILKAALEMAEQGRPIPRNPDPLSGPTVDLSELSPDERKAYVIADNRLALDAGWDDALLKLDLGDLKDSGFDITLTGFDIPELSRLFDAGDVEGQEDVPDVPEAPVSETGDVWLLGKHRMVCGDCTDPGVVAAALNGIEPHLMVTDPPYGVDYDAGWRNKDMPQKNDPNRWKDEAGQSTGKVINDGRVDWREAWSLFPGDVAYVWCASLHVHEVATGLLSSGFGLRSSIIWAKSNSVIGRGHYHWQHELCWYAVRHGSTGHWSGSRTQSTLWQIDKPQKSETGHSTQKPVECMKRPIENNSSPGQAVYDPFSGSGTTIIAAQISGRSAHAIEIHPAYVDVAVLRWQTFTNETATLEGDGRTFAEIAALRSLQSQAALSA